MAPTETTPHERFEGSYIELMLLLIAVTEGGRPLTVEQSLEFTRLMADLHESYARTAEQLRRVFRNKPQEN